MLKRFSFSLLILLILGLSIILFTYAQTPSPVVSSATQPENKGWLNELDTYTKVFGGVVALLGTLFGLPIVILNFQKTRAEIRKLELEAAKLQNETLSSDGVLQNGYNIEINDSKDVSVQILADPRFLAPLLLLLDFIFAWGILTLAGYVIGFFLFGFFRTVLIALLAAILLVPIIREARRVKSVLKPSELESPEKKVE